MAWFQTRAAALALCFRSGSTHLMTRKTLLCGSAALAALLVAAPAVGQRPVEDSVPGVTSAGMPAVHAEVFAGSELERYLRALQLTDQASLYPWSIRGFSQRELKRIAPSAPDHPWVGRYDLRPPSSRSPSVSLVRPSMGAVYNSAFPHGSNDGPTWAGRGATVSGIAGVAVHWGALSLTLAPRVFYAQNADFDLAPNGRSGDGTFADPLSVGIDHPQRFGDAGYGRLDPGESTLRVDLPFVAAGISTASQQWGPGAEQPIILGNNAGGFPHVFVGTAAPLDLRVARIHGRLVWGELAQSDYSLVDGDASRRFMGGIVALVEPPVRGLELGFARFYHTAWPDGGPGRDLILQPLESFLKVNRTTGLGNEDVSNQIASVFLRWVLPASGFELYGEYGREDHNWNFRDFLLEPDHTSSYLIGFQKGWSSSGGRLTVLRGELLNSQVSALEQVRGQSRFYVHDRVRQGHTQRGQILGSANGLGGGGGILAVDRYHRRGRWTLGTSRSIRNGHAPAPTADEPGPRGHDLIYTLDGEALMFLGAFDLSAGLSGVYNLNRNHQSDVFNLNAALGLTWTP